MLAGLNSHDLSDHKRWPKRAAIGWSVRTTVRDGRRCSKTWYYKSTLGPGRGFCANGIDNLPRGSAIANYLNIPFGTHIQRLTRVSPRFMARHGGG